MAGSSIIASPVSALWKPASESDISKSRSTSSSVFVYEGSTMEELEAEMNVHHSLCDERVVAPRQRHVRGGSPGAGWESQVYSAVDFHLAQTMTMK